MGGCCSVRALHGKDIDGVASLVSDLFVLSLALSPINLSGDSEGIQSLLSPSFVQ